MKFIDRIKSRIATAKLDADRAEKQRQEIEGRWPEVISRAASTPDRDALTALFIANLGGKS